MADAVRVDGLADLRRSLKAIDKGALKEVQKVTKSAAGLVAAEARSLAPRRSGRLAGSIRATTSGNKGIVRSPLPYAPVIEYGSPTRGIEGRRFVGRAMEGKQEAVTRALEHGFDQLARRNGWR